MKKSPAILIAACTFTFLLLLQTSEIFSHSGGANAGLSGGAGEQNCTSCHSDILNSGTGIASITSDIPVSGYIPGQNYTITASINQSGINKFGFEILSGYSATNNASEGSITITDIVATQIKISGVRRYVTHKSGGNSGSGSRAWSFDWQAPSTPEGSLTFFGAFNAANNNGSTSGDDIYTTSLAAPMDPVASSDIFSEYLEDHISIYPTITSSELTVQGDGKLMHEIDLQVISADGKMMADAKQLTPHHQKMMLDVSTLPNGMYFLRAGHAAGMKVFRFVKVD